MCLIDSNIKSGIRMNARELASRIRDRGVSCSSSSLDKTIKEMKLMFDAPIKYCQSSRSYYYENDYRFWVVFLQHWGNYLDYPKELTTNNEQVWKQ